MTINCNALPLMIYKEWHITVLLDLEAMVVKIVATEITFFEELHDTGNSAVEFRLHCHYSVP